MRLFLLISAMIIWGTRPGSKFVISDTSKMEFRRDSEASNGGGWLLLGVTGGKSGSTGNHGGPGIHPANARKIKLHQWKSGCNTNWYNQYY